jgi:predicted metal-dependent enzyme (double-stranded beta helix superfamily)
MSAVPAFARFIAELRALWRQEPDMGRRMAQAMPHLRTLVADPALKAQSAHWPSTEGRKNLLLHVDEEHGFAINAVVREPGRVGGVHDHAHAWVLYALLDGTERLERYDRIDDGARAGHAELRLASVTAGGPGKVDLVPPFAIHAEQGGPARSVAIILRSQRLGDGTVLQHAYDRAAGTVELRFGPTQIPYPLA